MNTQVTRTFFSGRLAGLLLFGWAATVFTALFARIPDPAAPARFATSASVAEAGNNFLPRYDVAQVTHGTTPFAHSVAVTTLPDGKLRAFWFGGSREGAADAALYSALFTPSTGGWSAATPVISPKRLQSDVLRWVRKVGNPVVIRDPQQRLHLYFVSVAAGGWAASAINTMVSTDNGANWGPARRLITTPFLNLSTLVKGAPVLFEDGQIGLPVYHEFAGKFGEFLRVSASGDVVRKTRLTSGRHSLQPVILPQTDGSAVAFLRYAGPPPGRVLAVRSQDRGNTWGTPEKTTLSNPNSALDALRLPDGALLVAFNNAEDSRNDLSLAHSRDDGRSWRVIRRLEHASDPKAEFSYPRLLLAEDGTYHLLYTVDKKLIRHARFNQAWLEGALK
ncbi:MAG: exo-alpha-sialidase [Burkholderiales bacterium]